MKGLCMGRSEDVGIKYFLQLKGSDARENLTVDEWRYSTIKQIGGKSVDWFQTAQNKV